VPDMFSLGAGVTPRHTWLHRWPAGLKLAVLMVMGSTLVVLENLWWLGAASLMSLLVWRSVAGPIVWHAWRAAVWLVLTIAAIVLYVFLFAGPWAAGVVFLRLVALFFAAMAVTASTPISHMMDVVQWALSPLDRRGWVDSEKVALMFGLSLRLVPVLFEQWQEIQQAQAARGISVSWIALLIPMLARTLKRADELAQAIDARTP
jgi:biotin transport system permease protein